MEKSNFKNIKIRNNLVKYLYYKKNVKTLKFL